MFLFCIRINLAGAEDAPFSLAIINGEGQRDVGMELLTTLEVALSQRTEFQLVERRQIEKVLAELALSREGFLAPEESLRLGEILRAQLLLFSERILVPGEGNTIRFRLVDSQTGIIVETLLEKEQEISREAKPLLEAILSAFEKLRVPLSQRTYIGILDLRSTEPGSSLDGTAEAFKMFLSYDLSRSPNIFVLDREHIQYLQNEKNLTGVALQLKTSAFLIEGGVRSSTDRSKIQFTVLLYRLDGSESQKFDIDLPASDIRSVREQMQKTVLEHLDQTAVGGIIGKEDMEAGMFLNRVTPLINAGQYEEAVRAAEVAYALQPGLESCFSAARAWFLLGFSMLEEEGGGSRTMARRISGRRRVRSASDDIGDQYQSTGHRGVRTIGTPESRDIAAKQARLTERMKTDIGNKMSEYWGSGESKGQAAFIDVRQPDVQQKVSSAQRPLTMPQEESSSSAIKEPVQKGAPPAADKDKRVLAALTRAVSLYAEYGDRYIQEFESGADIPIAIPDPFEQIPEILFQPGMPNKEGQSLWTSRFPLKYGSSPFPVGKSQGLIFDK